MKLSALARSALAALALWTSGCRNDVAYPPGAAPMASPRDLRFDTLLYLASAPDVRSVDDLVPRLPDDYRQRFVLVYDSRSEQAASYRSPRVVLYGRDARFILTYGGEPERPGYRALETMEFDDATRAFRFREITFSPGSSPAASASEINPGRCRACHGDTPRPIWDAYPTWPGVYGEWEGAAPDPRTKAGFAEFLRSRDASARYRALGGVDALLAAARPDDAAASYEGKAHLSRNAEFGARLQALAYLAIAREVTTSSRMMPFRFVLLASLDPRCLDVERFIPAAVRSGFTRSLRDFEAETDRANRAEDDAKIDRLPGKPPACCTLPREALTPFRYVVEEGLGISTRNWTLAFDKSTYDFTTSGRSVAVLEREMGAVVARRDPDLRLLADRHDAQDAYCSALRTRSLEALTSLSR